MERSATVEELTFDVTFTGMTEEDYLYLISMAKSIKAKAEAERTYARIRAVS